jgi:hypothetical protein
VAHSLVTTLCFEARLDSLNAPDNDSNFGDRGSFGFRMRHASGGLVEMGYIGTVRSYFFLMYKMTVLQMSVMYIMAWIPAPYHA